MRIACFTLTDDDTARGKSGSENVDGSETYIGMMMYGE
jgi:hypothetical protein